MKQLHQATPPNGGRGLDGTATGRPPDARLLQRLRGEPALWLTLLLLIPAVLPLTAPGYFFNAHDAHHSVFYLVEFDQAIKDGALWPVWGPDFALGFGYPLWLLYAPLAYYAAEFFHLLGLGFTVAVKATWLLAFLLGAVGTYKMARRWWGPIPAMVAALAYTYAPYHLVQIYVRAALAEFFALALFPWVLLSLDQLWDDPRPRRVAAVALAFGALLLTHSVPTLLLAPLIVGFLLVRWVSDWRTVRVGGASLRDSTLSMLRTPLVVGGALALGGLLSSIYVLPMLLERGYIVQAQWVQDTYNYALHFVYPNQLFEARWGFGYSVSGADDGMSFQLGIVAALLALIGAAGALRRPPRSGAHARVDPGADGPELTLRLPYRHIALFFLLATVVALFAMTPASERIWDLLPLVSLVQFPWRLLSLTALTLSILAACGTYYLGRRSGSDGGPWGTVAALLIVFASYPYTRPELVAVRPEDEQPVAVVEFETKYPDMRGITVWSERVPRDADSPLLPAYLAGEPLQRAAIVSGEGTVSEQQSGGASARARVDARTAVHLRFYTYYFPGWQATVDGQPVAIQPDPPNGLIALDLEPGAHEVRLRFGSTPARRIGAGVSLAALVAVIALLVWDGRRSRRELAKAREN